MHYVWSHVTDVEISMESSNMYWVHKSCLLRTSLMQKLLISSYAQNVLSITISLSVSINITAIIINIIITIIIISILFYILTIVIISVKYDEYSPI